jgi:chemotaxis protein CheX
MIDEKTIIEFMTTSTADVFSTMLGTEVSSESPYTDHNAPTVADGVLAFVGMAGPWAGTGVIACSAAFACRISNQLLMSDSTSVNEEVLDAVGEVANMIVGNFKTMIEEHLGPMGLSIPTVIYGRNFTSRSLGTSSWTVLPFRCGDETVTIRCCLAPSNRTLKNAVLTYRCNLAVEFQVSEMV